MNHDSLKYIWGRPFLLIFALAFLGHHYACAALKAADIFSDNMVIQRDSEVSIWGMADPGEEVTVTFNGQRQSGQANAAGKWIVKLPPEPASTEGRELLISTEKSDEQIILNDVIVGEVWLAGGQSNMEWNLRASEAGKRIYADLNKPLIRFFKVPRIQGHEEVPEEAESWTKAIGRQSGSFSAVAYFFAEKIQQTLGVPVGIVSCSLGASSAEAWMSREHLMKYEDFHYMIDELDRAAAEYDASEYLRYLDDQKQWQQIMRKKGREGAGPPPKLVLSPYTRKAATNLYRNMLATVIPYTIKGTIWYQGEANARKAEEYRSLFPALIENWREDFQQPDMPFYFVQLTTFYGFTADRSLPEEIWAELREAQSHTDQEVPATSMAVIVDLGERLDIHPRKKKEVGERLALLARKNLYGESELLASGPGVNSHTIVNGAVHIQFQDIGSGLLAKNGGLNHFEVAGPDLNFKEARAFIKGETVIVTADEVADPAAVRYGWENWFIPSLFNLEGLPASPFVIQVRSTGG